MALHGQVDGDNQGLHPQSTRRRCRGPDEYPKDYDFSPRADIEGSTLSLRNEGDEGAVTSIELNSEQMNTAERDRMLELRVKFAVEGMHGVLTHKTKNTRIAPNAKKLAEPRWKTVLPLSM